MSRQLVGHCHVSFSLICNASTLLMNTLRPPRAFLAGLHQTNSNRRGSKDEKNIFGRYFTEQKLIIHQLLFAHHIYKGQFSY